MSSHRIIYLEVLRIIATIAVLVNHIPLVAIHLYDDSVGDNGKFIINGIVHIVHFAVPVFVMITGALLLDKDRPISWRKAWNYTWRMIVILGTVGVVFAWMEIFFEERHFNLLQIPYAIINTLQGKTWTHLWYLYMLVGLYLLLPMLKATVNTLAQKQLDILIVILFLFAFVNPMLRHFADINIGIRFPLISEYVAYMLMGYRFSQVKGYPNLWFVIGIVIALYCMVAWLEYIKGHISLTVLAAYNSPLMAIYSVFIFLATKKIVEDNNVLALNNGWMAFSRDSFGIYVFHMLYVNSIYKVLKVNPFEDGFWTFIPILIVVTMLSWVSTIIFRKLPLIGKYI